MESSGNILVPRTTAWYWICQAAGWSGFLTYVLVGYYFNAREHRANEVVGIVVLSIVVPILMTHGLRYWMYIRGWAQLKEWKRKVRQFTAAPIFAAVCTLGVAVAAGIPQKEWVRSIGAWWTFVAYDFAFGGWLWAYERAHAHRSRRELELVAREAQLRALRTQLNPHFLFNSLNSVRSLITENPRQAAAMVTGLADILRYSLASDRHDTVPLADEIAIVDEYVGLERARLEDRLRVEQVVDPAALGARVPPMLVQTLVENAVKHGIAPLSHGGLVRLEARVTDGRVEIIVSNPGRLSAVAGDGGYGLSNARERLRLLYGELASLTLRDDGGRTTAAVTLPVEARA